MFEPSTSVLAAAFILSALLIITLWWSGRNRQYKKLANQAQQRTGTVFFLGDESGSVSQDDRRAMNNAALTLLHETHAAGRNFFYIGFCHEVHPDRIFHFPAGKDNHTKLKALGEGPLHGGGTNYTPPLQEVLTYLQDSQEHNVDVVIHSDGMAPKITILDALKDARINWGTRFHTVYPRDHGRLFDNGLMELTGDPIFTDEPHLHTTAESSR